MWPLLFKSFGSRYRLQKKCISDYPGLLAPITLVHKGERLQSPAFRDIGVLKNPFRPLLYDPSNPTENLGLRFFCNLLPMTRD